MEQKVDTKRKVMKVRVWIMVILALLGTVHILVNYFNIVDVLKAMHGG